MSDLPHRDQDPVLTLYAHYFLAADLMLENFEKTDAKAAKLKNPDRIRWQIGIYFSTWLGFLGVTCEGFNKVNPWLTLQKRPEQFKELLSLAGKVNRMIKLHDDALRKFRNSVFHLRNDTDDMVIFLVGDANRLTWAKDLHKLLDDFFSEYRVLCQVTYALEDRRL